MKIFVTGSTGFIGTYVTETLSKAGHDLVCLVWEKEAANPPQHLIRLGAELVIGDVTDPSSYREAMIGCDALVHLAGIYTTWEPDPSIYARINVDGTRAVMEAAVQSQIKKVIEISTYAIWASTPDSPFTESSPPGTAVPSEYARSKRLGELEAWKLHKEKGLPIVVIYPTQVIGAGDTRPTGTYLRDLIDHRLPATFFTRSIMTFVYVRDVALAILRALEKPDNIGEGYIIGKERLTVGEYNRMIAEASGVKLPLFSLPDILILMTAWLLTGVANLIKRPPLWGASVDEIHSLQLNMAADGSKAERELGIRYTPVCEAVEESVAWYREQKNL